MGRMGALLGLFGLGLLVAAASGSTTLPPAAVEEAEDSLRFKKWMSAQGRSYLTAEEWQLRFDVYRANRKHIEDFNRNRVAAGLTYSLGEGPFTDLTHGEYVAQFLSAAAGTSPPRAQVAADEFYINSSALAPTTVDWRMAGAVTSVKNQAGCAACWAFAAVASVEGIHQIKTGELLSLSEQEILDCSQSGDCRGGWAWRAFRWMAVNGGISTESDYQYTQSTGTCDSSKSCAATITGYRFVEPNSEVSLMNAVANQPVVVSIDGMGPDFQHYADGIFNGECSSRSLNHDLTVVGYGQDNEGNKYWILKNSWGLEWGDNGYVYMKKDIKTEPWGICGLATMPVFPIE